MKQKIVFFGSGIYTIPVIQKLLEHGLDLVITTEKNPESKFLKFCAKNNIQTILASNPQDLTNHKSLITNHSLGVLASFGAIVPRPIIDSFPRGIINIHPSLLPKWKGPSPVQYQLLNGETTVGVTIIKLDDQVDHGPILAQKPYNLQGNETAEDLLSILFEIGADLVIEQIEKLEKDEELVETPQDHSQETWSYKISKKDGQIDLSQLPASKLEIGNWKLEIERRVRAYYPWPGVWFRCHPELARPERGRRVSGSSKLSNKIIKLLPENRIQVEGKNPMNYKDFINGYESEGEGLLKKLSLY